MYMGKPHELGIEKIVGMSAGSALPIISYPAAGPAPGVEL
jgi:hypothetical protein